MNEVKNSENVSKENKDTAVNVGKKNTGKKRYNKKYNKKKKVISVVVGNTTSENIDDSVVETTNIEVIEQAPIVKVPENKKVIEIDRFIKKPVKKDNWFVKLLKSVSGKK